MLVNIFLSFFFLDDKEEGKLDNVLFSSEVKLLLSHEFLHT